MKSTRGVADPITLILVVVCLGGAAKLAGWKPLDVFRPKPPTVQVTQLQTDLAKAQAEAAAARQAADLAAAAERARQADQARYAQQMGTGAALALDRVPAASRTPETQLASDLLARANLGLAAAIGALPREQQAEIIAIVGQALSHVQAERDQARDALAAKDAQLQTTTREREQFKAQLPVLAAQLETKDATARAIAAELTLKTKEVVAVADRLDAERRQSGSLSASLQRLGFWAAVIVGLYLFLAYVAPLLLKVMRPGTAKTILRNVSGTLTGGLHFLDAKRKLSTRLS